MDRIKIKDAATEQGMKPEELVARLREAGIEKTVKGSLSPEEYEKVKVKKSEASVEVVRKDVIIRRRSKPAAAEAPAAPVPECRQIPGFPVKKEGFPPDSASVRWGGKAETGAELLKNRCGNCPYGAFLRLGGRFRAAKTEFLC